MPSGTDVTSIDDADHALAQLAVADDVSRFKQLWPEIERKLTSNDPKAVSEAISDLESALASCGESLVAPMVEIMVETNEVIEEILALAAIPSDGDTSVQVTAAKVVSYMVPVAAADLNQRGLVGTLIAMMENGDDELQLISIWNLALVAAWSDELKQAIVDCGKVETVIAKSLAFPGDVAFFLQNMCLGQLEFDQSLSRVILAAAASVVIDCHDPEVVEAGCWVLELFLKRGDDYVVAIVAIAGVVDRLVHIITHGSVETQFPSLRTLANLVLGPQEPCQQVIDAGLVVELTVLLHHHHPVIRKDVCWTISNVCGGTTAQIQTVIDAGIFPSLAGVLTYGEYATKQAALWAVANVVMGSEATTDQLQMILTPQLIRGVVRLLRVDEDDGSLAIEALEVVATVVDRMPSIKPTVASEGLAYLEECQGEAEVKHLRRKAAKVVAALDLL